MCVIGLYRLIFREKMPIAFDNADFADYLLNTTKPVRNKFFKRITEHKNFERIVHQLGLTPVVTLVRLSQEEVNVYKSSKHNKTYIGLNMSNQIKPHKDKHLSFNNSCKEFSKLLTNKKHVDLFGDNESLKIHPNKLIRRSHSNHSTKENLVKKNKDPKKFNYVKDKNIFKDKEKYFKDRKEDNLSSKHSISSSSKTKSRKTKDKYESKHRNSSDNKTNSNENKISRSKMKETLPTSKNDRKNSNTKKLNMDSSTEVNSSVTHSKTYNNIDKLKINQDTYKPKKIINRRKFYQHGDKVPHNDEEEESLHKRRNSHTSSKTKYLESDKKLNILQTNTQLSASISQLRKRSTSSDIQSNEENLTKHTPEKIIKLSQNSTKITDSKKEGSNENKVYERTDITERRKRSNSEFSLFTYEVDFKSESKRPKTTDGGSPGFSAFSSLDHTEIITIDKTQILPPINDLNSPYVSFGDFLKNKSVPIIESFPQASEFSCTLLEGDKLLIKKRNTEKKAIVIDITDEDDEPNNNTVVHKIIESTSKKKCDVKIKTIANIAENLKCEEDSSDAIDKGKTHKATIESSSNISPKKNLNVKIKNCDNKINVGESLNNGHKSALETIDKGKTQKSTESSSKISPEEDCDAEIQNYKKTNVSESLDNSFDSINKAKKHKTTETISISSPEKNCDVKIKSSDNKVSVVERLDNSYKSSSDLINKRKKQTVAESFSKVSPTRDYNAEIESSDNKISVVESSDKTHESSSDSTKKKKIQKATESFSEILPKKDYDIEINSSDNMKTVVKSLDTNNEIINNKKKADSICLTESYKNDAKENLKENSTSDKHSFKKFKILFTNDAVEFIASEMISVLNVYVDFKQYTEKLSTSKSCENNKDYFINNRSKFLKILCKKLQSAKVYRFKIGDFFDSLIESIKIHICSKEILNEKTINRFIHNVLHLFKENCSAPDDHYILYNHVVSVKSLQYLDQKSFNLCGSVNKHIIDCMNSFSVKLERSYKDNALQSLFCIDNSPDKITDVTPGNSLPCINTGENLVTKISPIRLSKIDMIPQISIVDSSTKNNDIEQNLIDLLQNIPLVANLKNCVFQSTTVENNTSNQSTTTEKINKDVVIDSIESTLDALFNEKSPVIQNTNVNMEKSQSSNYETGLLNSGETINKTKIVDSPNSDNSDSMNFLKNINPNKSYLAPISNDKNVIIHSVEVSPTSTLGPKTNKDTSNKNITILNDIVVTPATKQIPFKPQSNPVQKTNISTKRIETEINSGNKKSNSISDIVNPSPSKNLTPPKKILKKMGNEEKNKVTKRPYVRRKLLNERNKKACFSNTTGNQLPKEKSTTLPRPFPTAAIQNDIFIPTRVEMKDYLNSEVANVSATSHSSYMMDQIPQLFNSLPKSTAAPITSLYLPHPYCDPAREQQIAPTTVRPPTQSQFQSQTNPVPLARQLSGPSQLQKPPPAPTITRPLYLPPLLTEVVPPSTICQSYIPNNSTSEPVYQSSYASSLGATPLNLQFSIPRREEIMHNVVVERTLVQQFKTQTVHAQQTSNLPSYNQNMYEKHLHERNRQAFRQQQAEQERQKERLRQKKHQEMLRQRQRQLEEHERLKQQYKQEMLKKHQQDQQEMRRLHQQYFQYNSNNNKNKTTMFNSNNYYSIPSGQVAQSNPNEYMYPTYQLGYPAICDYFMPQLIQSSPNVRGESFNYLNNQQTTPNEITGNTVPTAAISRQSNNNNLIYPPMTYLHPNFYEASNNSSHQNSLTNNYLMQATVNQTAINPDNVSMQNNTVSSVSHTSVIVTNNVSDAITTSSHRNENEQQLLKAGAPVVNTFQSHPILWKQNETQKKDSNKSLEQHINELEELLNNDSDTTGSKEMDNSVVRNSSRDSGYITPTKQFQKDQTCAHCLGVGSFICSGCVNVYYCSEDCQTKAWPSHQNVCDFEG